MSTENNLNNEVSEIVEEKPRRRRGPGKKEYKLKVKNLLSLSNLNL